MAKITINIPDSHIEHMRGSCQSQYWAEIRRVEVDFNDNDDEMDDVYIREIDRCDGSGEPGDWILLTRDVVRRGIELMATVAPERFARLLSDEQDGDDGDVWLQLAVLGEVKYG